MLEFLKELFEEHGAVAFALALVGFLLYKLVWRVWDRAMKAKDDEIERLVEQRNKYQNLVFERLLSSKPEEVDRSLPEVAREPASVELDGDGAQTKEARQGSPDDEA